MTDLQELIQLVLEAVPVSGTSVSEPDQRGVGVSLHGQRSVAEAWIAADEGSLLLELRRVVVQRLVENPQVEAPEGGNTGREEGHEDDELDPAADAAAAKLPGLGVPAVRLLAAVGFIVLLKVSTK